MISPAAHGDAPLLTAAQTRAADEAAVARGATWDALLAQAGAGLARVVLRVIGDARGGVYGRRATIVAGKGDNGGDGWVAAGLLRDRGVAVTVVAPFGLDAPTSQHSERARTAWLTSGGRATEDVTAIHLTSRWFADQPVLVDCLLGTGAQGAPRGAAAEAVAAMAFVARNPSVPLVACDVPSGVDADTGVVAGDPRTGVVTADVTVTFGAAKRGLALHPGAAHAGRVEVVGLGPRWQLPEVDRADAWYATADGDARVAPWPATSDKVARGRVTVIAGSHRYAGAAALAGAAAVRSGAGLVTVATTADPAALLALEPGMMIHQLAADDTDVGGPAAATSASAVDAAATADAIVLGPGLGHGPGARTVVEAVLQDARERTDGPVVVLDADALNVFRGDAASLRAPVGAEAGDPAMGFLDLAAAVHGPQPSLVLTPHERELARLLGVDVEQVRADRAGAAQQLAAVTGAIVVAKGPGTVVASPDGPVAVVTSGGPALGTGGSGDVLAGMLGAALAAQRGGDVAHVVAMTVHRHGMLGDRAGAASGGRATARDLLTLLPSLLAELTESRP